jgi:transcriptional regulator with XRE-family HTH domain
MKKFAKATEINKRVKQVRERVGLTQKDFAAQIGVSRSFLSEIEAGKVKPSVESLIGIVTRFQIDPHWLLIGAAGEREGDFLAAEPTSGYPSVMDRQSAYPVIPLLDDRAVSGPPHVISGGDIASYLPVWGAIFQKEMFCFHLRDDAMSPLLRQGALVGAIPISAPVKKWEGKLVVLWPAKGGMMVRRFRIDQKYFIFEAENKNYSAIYLERSTRPVLYGVDWWWQSQ